MNQVNVFLDADSVAGQSGATGVVHDKGNQVVVAEFALFKEIDGLAVGASRTTLSGIQPTSPWLLSWKKASSNGYNLQGSGRTS